MPIDKNVTIRFKSSWEEAEKIQKTQEELYQFENVSSCEQPDGLVSIEMYIDGNWWEQEEDNITLSKLYPTIQFEIETSIFGEDTLTEILLNGEEQPIEGKGWLGLTLEEIVEEYGEGESLDGDDVDRVCEIIKHKLNLFQGNITEAEYEKLMNIEPEVELQGEFNGDDYEVFGFRFEWWNNDEGFTTLSVFYGDEEVSVLSGIERIYSDDDKLTIKGFEGLAETIIKGFRIK